jgi:hypothetical protein
MHSSDEKKGLSDSWAVTNGRFLRLQKFYLGLASVFPNTVSVKSDFSMINWEKRTSRQGLTDFSL